MTVKLTGNYSPEGPHDNLCGVDVGNFRPPWKLVVGIGIYAVEGEHHDISPGGLLHSLSAPHQHTLTSNSPPNAISGIRQELSELLDARGYSGDRSYLIGLAVTEFIDNAVGPRSADDPEYFEAGRCDVILGDYIADAAADKERQGSYVSIASRIPSPEVAFNVWGRLGSTGLVSTEEVHGRGNFLATWALDASGVEIDNRFVFYASGRGEEQDQMAVVLRIPPVQ